MTLEQQEAPFPGFPWICPLCLRCGAVVCEAISGVVLSRGQYVRAPMLVCHPCALRWTEER